MTKNKALHLIADKIATCTKCSDLSSFRTKNHYQTVAGEGKPDTRILIVGEAPGENEAMSGRPFVGRAGKLLDILISRIGWNRDNVFITNILKCRPPANRDPSSQEVCNCLPYLTLQIKVIQPDWIICLGRVAALNLLKPEDIDENWWYGKSLNSFRKMIHDYHGIKTICTYHPSYLLRNFSAEKDFISDLKLIKTKF